MASHSSTLAWKIPWMEEPGGLQSMGSLRVGHNWATSLSFHFHALEKEMATHSGVLAWRIPGTGEPGGLPSMGSHRVRHDWSDLAAAVAVSSLFLLVCFSFHFSSVQFSSVQMLSRVRLFATPWIAARQASLFITISWSSLRLTSIESVMPSSHLILCRPLLLLPSISPSIRVFSSESTVRMRWPKYWSFSFSIIPSKEHPGLISFRLDWVDLLVVQGTLKSLFQHHNSKASNWKFGPLLLCKPSGTSWVCGGKQRLRNRSQSSVGSLPKNLLGRFPLSKLATYHRILLIIMAQKLKP